MTTQEFVKNVDFERFLGNDGLKKLILDDAFLGMEKIQDGFKLMLADGDLNIYIINTADNTITNADGTEKAKLPRLLKNSIDEILRVEAIKTDQLFTLQEVADFLNVSRQTIYNYVTAKRLPASKIGKEYRVTGRDLYDFLKNGRTD